MGGHGQYYNYNNDYRSNTQFGDFDEVMPDGLHSFSGSNIKASCYIPPENLGLFAGDYPLGSAIANDGGAYVQFGELQTIALSSARSSGAVRVLGESFVKGYTLGTRTIAGTLIFAVVNRDVFAKIARVAKNEISTAHPYFVDQIPPFDIILTATTEYPIRQVMSVPTVNPDGTYGSREIRAIHRRENVRQVISGIRLVNTGTTYSVNDVYTEASYTYVAEWASPFIPLSEWSQLASRLRQDRGSRRSNGFRKVGH